MLMSSSFSCASQRVMLCVHPKQLGFFFNRNKDGARCKHLIDSSEAGEKKMLWLAASECKTYIFFQIKIKICCPQHLTSKEGIAA